MSSLSNNLSTYKYTKEELQTVLGVSSLVAVQWLVPLNYSCVLAEIITREQAAAYLAQLGHESGCLRYTEELWGTPQQLKYEIPHKLASVLGNTYKGDGLRYKGRGLLQITGRANYRACTLGLRRFIKSVPDFELEPKLLATKEYAALSCGLYWRAHKLNSFVDRFDFVGLTKRINGGTNGLAHRQSLYVQGLLNLH